jgi:hypothetical protein
MRSLQLHTVKMMTPHTIIVHMQLSSFRSCLSISGLSSQNWNNEDIFSRDMQYITTCNFPLCFFLAMYLAANSIQIQAEI